MTPADLQKKLAELMEKASENHFYIKKEEVEEAFTEFQLDEKQMKLVHEFLMSKRIVVGGMSKDNGEAEIKPEWTKEEENFLVQFREDLMAMPLLKRDSDAFSKVFAAAASGDANARNKLSEVFMQDIVDEAVRAYNGTVLLPDMIQEGNLRMILALDIYDYAQENALENLYDTIMEDVTAGMYSLMEEQKDVKARDERLVYKVEDLRDSIDILKDEMGRKVYLDEVADFMSISEEEAEDIMRLAGDDIAEDKDEETNTEK